jgi:hypothetical protein
MEAVLFPALSWTPFAGAWVATSLALSWQSGWRALARRYRAAKQRCGTRFPMQSGRVGAVNYRRCLTVGVSDAGLYLAVLFYLRIGHPPLLIPWSDLTVVAVRDRWYARDITLAAGDPRAAGGHLAARLRLPLRVAREAVDLGAALPGVRGEFQEDW